MLRSVFYFYLGVLLVALLLPAISNAEDRVCIDTENGYAVLTYLNYQGSYEYTGANSGWWYSPGQLTYLTSGTGYKYGVSSASSTTCAAWVPDFTVVTGPPSEAAPPIPETCNNDVQDPDEDGVNCGGVCGNECNAYACPDGWVGDDYMLENGETEFQCWPASTIAMNSLGQCPAGTTGIPYDNPTECTPNSLPEPIAYNADDPEPDVAAYAVPQFTKTSLSTVKQVYPETVEDNGDGTETATIIRTVETTNNETNITSSNTLTTNVIRPSGSEPGTGFDGMGVADGYEGNSFIGEETDGSDNPNNYNWDGTIAGLDEITGELSEEEQTEKKDIFGTIQGLISSLPIVEAINNVTITVTNPTCVLNAGVFYGKQLSFDFCRWETFLRSIGAMMVAFAQFSAIFVVFRGIK